jgi:arsenite/tail-anchored protein-transporting ATPase
MNRVSESLSLFLQHHPKMKYVFFGGKGGVGKTVFAGATALYLAEQGREVLLASTNPVHSLSGLLKQNVFGRETLVEGTPLKAIEIDTKDTIEKKKVEIREKIEWFLKYADLAGQKTEDFVESATMNPAFEESAMFERMVDLMFENRYDTYVFDTAPTANARRLLGMSKVYTLWVEKMLASRGEARSLRKALSFSKKEEKDPLLDYLLHFRDRIDKVHKLLTDAELTAFFFVTLPEALPIAVIKRFIGWFREFGIPVGGVIVNGLIDRDQVTDSTHEFVMNRIASQERYLEDIYTTLPDVRAIMPRLDHEIQGIGPIRETFGYLFS